MTVPRLGMKLSDWDIPLAALAMALVSFSLPMRDAPETADRLDWIGVVKFAIRLLIVFWFGLIWLRIIFSRQLTTNDQPIPGDDSDAIHGLNSLIVACMKRLTPVLTPWYLFLAWSMLTIGWSALPAFSAGQWLGLLGLILFAQAVAQRYDLQSLNPVSLFSEKLIYPKSTSKLSWKILVYQLSFVLTAYCAMVLAVYLIAPQFSGLDRTLGFEGMVHPTAVGAASSLGIVLTLMLLLRQWSESRYLLIASLMIHFPVLLVANARAAILMAAVAVFLITTLLMGRLARGLVFFAIAMVIMLVVLFDPGMKLIDGIAKGSGDYLARGQTSDQLKEVSGRSELWEILWIEFWKAPLQGHGYFVTSEGGRIFVWGESKNQDAHNVFFQPFVSTGIIGGLIFLVAIWRIGKSIFYLLRFDPKENPRREVGVLWAIIGIWFLGWGLGCTSFLGPVRPESVVFFGLLGLLAGASSDLQRRQD